MKPNLKFKTGFEFIIEQLFPGMWAAKANKIVDERYNILGKKGIDYTSNENSEKLLLQLQEDFKKQQERKKGIEDKAKTTFATISISVTAITLTLNYNSISVKTGLGVASVVCLILSVIYIIMSSIRAIQTINIRAYHVFQATIDTEGADIVIKAFKSEEEQIRDLAYSKVMNDTIITKLSNFGYAAAVLVRNGIILFGTFFILALAQKLSSENIAIEPLSNKDSVFVIVPNTTNVELQNKQIHIVSDSLLRIADTINRKNKE